MLLRLFKLVGWEQLARQGVPRWQVVFAEQLFAALVGSGGNSRLAIAALYNRDLIVWTGHFVFLLSDFGQKKSRRPFSDFLPGVPLGAAGI